MVVAVALDTAGVPAVRDFIRPTSVELPPLLKDIMGWDDKLLARAAVPEYPCLIDQKHITGELYGFINVPMATWIDEEGHIVRPAEPSGVSDGVRAMDPATFKIPEQVVAAGKQLRTSYIDAIRDWVNKGAKSEFVLSREEILRRSEGPDATDALASANFRLGQYLLAEGHREDALPYFAKARELYPESWSYKRQTWELEQAGKASGPEFFAAVQALGHKHYYAPVKLKASN